MYRPAIAALTATSAVLLATAAAANAEEARATAAQCSNRDGYSVNVSPPPPMSGEITADDLRAAMKSAVSGTFLAQFFAPALDATAPSLPVPRPNLAPLSAAASDGFPTGDTLEDLINRALECARRTEPRGAKLPIAKSAPISLNAGVIDPAACAPAAGSAQSPGSLLGSLGVNQLLSTLFVNQVACVPVAPATPANRPATLMDAIGVTGLVDEFVDD